MDTITSLGSTLKHQGHRFLLSPCGQRGKWVHPAECGAFAGWIDCTDMDDEQYQRHVAMRLANRYDLPEAA